jgi:hypothetical protein
MTQLLEKALIAVYELPPAEQDAIAALILDELTDEARWNETFASSQESLAKLADKVREEVRKGRVKKLGFDEL